METPDLETETYETIPWSHLAPTQTPLVTRIASAVLALAAAGALTLVLASVLRGDAPGVVVTVPPPVAQTENGVPATVEPLIPVTADDADDGGAVRLYSEADLMAVIPEEEQRIAATRAEWFVSDYFTVDGDPTTTNAVRAALPVGIDVALPHDAAGGVSYVEWVGVLAVRADGPSRYAVDVAFRTLAGAGDGQLHRQPVRAVRIRIGIEEGTFAAVLDLPEPIRVPVATIDVPIPDRSEPPDGVVRDVTAAGAAFGSVDDVIASGVDAFGWRVVVAVRDASGLEFPLTVRP